MIKLWKLFFKKMEDMKHERRNRMQVKLFEGLDSTIYADYKRNHSNAYRNHIKSVFGENKYD